jgi:3-isopropylmalate dehydrogenase
MKTYKIGIIAGDGIGPEVMREGLKVLQAIAAQDGFAAELVEYPYSGEYYLKTKELVPERVIDEWRTLDAVLLGAIGHPDVEPGLVERSVILGLRFGLDLYINLRPIKLYAERLCPLKNKGPADIDFEVVRENTEGLYSQIGGHLKKGTPDEVAMVTGVYTWKGCTRAIRYAFEVAVRRAEARGPEGFSPSRDRSRLCRRGLHVDDQEPRVVRRGGNPQLVRRHHYRPGGDAAGGHGHRRLRQPAPGPDLHV